MTTQERIRNILILEDMKKNKSLSRQLGLRDKSQIQTERSNSSNKDQVLRNSN